MTCLTYPACTTTHGLIFVMRREEVVSALLARRMSAAVLVVRVVTSTDHRVPTRSTELVLLNPALAFALLAHATVALVSVGIHLLFAMSAATRLGYKEPKSVFSKTTLIQVATSSETSVSFV